MNEQPDQVEKFLKTHTDTTTLDLLRACFEPRPEGWGHLDRLLASKYLREAGFQPYQSRADGSRVSRWRLPPQKKKPELPNAPLYMKDFTFYRWLMKNRWRADPIGDLARDVYTDRNWPQKANSWKSVKAALPEAAFTEVKEALKAAWTEYELFVGGPSHIDPDTWVHGVTGSGGLEVPEDSMADKPPEVQ